MADFPDFAQLSNLELIEQMYAQYCADPKSVEASWAHFFQGIDFAKFLEKRGEPDRSGRILELIRAYRKYGHLQVRLNPIAPSPAEPAELSLAALGFSALELGELFPTHGFCAGQEAPLRDIVEALRQVYASRIGFEYMDLGDGEMEQWIQSQIEPRLAVAPAADEQRFLLEYLNKAESFETFLHTKYVGQKRFSIEGGETLIPMLAEILAHGAEQGMEQFVFGMAHRGRLNVLANILGKSYAVIFQEFEDVFLPLELEGSGDVKYHKGFSADVQTRFGKKVHVHLSANSSCLESVDAVALGIARAKQTVLADAKRQKVGAVLMHGDASLSGQGVVYESLELMQLPGYTTGGTIHIVVNNQIGFTTLPEEGRSTHYCTDIARTFGCPVLHVNAEDPESCLFAAKLSVELRLRFQRDVFIDLNCYRKYGHNEGDEPAFTQPSQYREIRARQTIRELYLKTLPQNVAAESEERFRAELEKALTQAKGSAHAEPEERFGSSWGAFTQPSADTLFKPFDTRVAKEVLQKAAAGYCHIPAEFHLHPKLEKWVAERLAMKSIDWGMAECLAFGSLLLQQVPIRLAGQDSRRGTFSQRHAVWIDQENGSLYFPYSHLAAKQASFEVYNSPLSEFACLAFEYGYTWGDPKSLVLWEAQYGDFTIGAQTVIDHYITTAEQKWARYSSLTLLLPHGYEGQGPEHSSARIERFLQLAAQNNVQVANLSTPAQYFHILRRQALRPIKKPLILFTPKSLIRLPACASSLEELANGEFQELIDDAVGQPNRLLICSGRVYYDLAAEREKRKRGDIALVRIEQLYPLHKEKMEAILGRYRNCSDVCWVQDEPQNMGAWEFLAPHLTALLPQTRYVGRVRNAVTATGSHKQHKLEQDQFMNEAFR